MKMTNDLRESLQVAMATTVLDSMTIDQLEDFAFFQLLETYDKMSNKDFVALVKTHQPELL